MEVQRLVGRSTYGLELTCEMDILTLRLLQCFKCFVNITNRIIVDLRLRQPIP